MMDTKSRVIREAQKAFLEHGYDASIDEIAKAANVVRQTVYNVFGSKARLFEAVVWTTVRDTRPIGMMDFRLQRDVAEGLRELGMGYLTVMLDPRSLQLFRILSSQISKYPDMPLAAHKQTSAPLKARLVNYINAHVSERHLKHCNADMAAEQFLGLLLGQAFLRAAQGLDIESTRKMKIRVDAAVSVFMAAYGR